MALFASVLPALVIMAIVFDDLSTLLKNQADLDEAQDLRRAGLDEEKIEEFDYVIIGAGSAGGVVANRLSRDQRNRVFVLQDGGNPSSLADVPGLDAKLRNSPYSDYSYQIQKQENACLAPGIYNTTCIMSRGIGLGGSSNLFSMSVVRGNPADYDRWAELTGNPIWRYSNVLNVFKNLENYHGYYQPTDTRYHGERGESYVTPQQHSELFPNFFGACAELGLPLVDANANQSVGCAHLDLNGKGGVRWGSYNAFLKPILGRSNLKIYRYAKATKILFDESMRAVGVNYVRHGVKHTIYARHEVILCAGAIDSPKLLMLSGIGPIEALRDVGIKPLLNLPIGLGLYEHVGTSLEFTVNQPLAFVVERDFNHQVAAQYATTGSGPLAAPVFNPRGLFFLTSREFNSPNRPDMMVTVRGQHNVSLLNGTYPNKILFEFFLLRPLSAGYVSLASADHNDPPIIDPRLFSHASDVRRLTEGIQSSLRFLETEPFKQLEAELVAYPACKQPFKSKEYFECVLRQDTYLRLHPSGTVRMGRKGDPSAALDADLRVLGTYGLRVVDCSVMPSIPAGELHTPALMIGEIGARLILESRQL